jgi:HPt (histidine-containing phosphotransfer) domain-containing protein
VVPTQCPEPAPEKVRDGIAQFDPQALARLNRWGGEQLVREMTALFRAEVPVRLHAAREAVSTGQSADLYRAAHSLKSSCAQLGAVRMTALTERVETLSAQGTLDGIDALLDRLDEEFASVTAWLESGLDSATEVEP